jgi:5'-3' exonuclease
MKFMKIGEVDHKNSSNLLLVDSLNLAFRWKHSGSTDFAYDMINTIKSLAKSYDASDIVVAGDWGSSWRKEIYPEYKGNREEKRNQQTEEERKDFEDFLEELNNAYVLVVENGWPLLRFKGVEADDIIAYIVKNYSDKYEHTWIISSDKDFDQLVNNNVSRFSYVTRKETTIDKWPYEVPVGKYIDLKVLQGDAGDNVPKPEGLGPKRSIGLLENYESIFDLIADLPIDSSAKYIKNLNEFGVDNLLRNFKLMALEEYCEEAIGEHIDEIDIILGSVLK